MRRLAQKLHLGDRFMFVGPREDASQFIAACDVFALSSHYEGLPLAVMEALALGVPVVATKVAGVTELVRDGVDGILTPKARPDLLAKGLESLIRDPERRCQLSAAASNGAKRFDNRPAVAMMETMYRTLADRASSESDRRRHRS
jgi:glycosyltransferase involved in cell wall biosynthesis